MARLLSDEQLREIAEAPSQKALRALAAGDVLALNGRLHEMAAGPLSIEALALHSITRMVGELRQDFGEPAARRLLDRIGSQLMRSFAADYQAGREREVIVDLVSVFKHQGRGNIVPVTETDDEVVYDLSPCGSGGRFLVDGSVDASPAWYGRWSDGVASYCQCCKACQRALNDATGVPAWTTDISASVPGRCTMRFRKTRARGTRLFDGAELYGITRTRIALALEKTARQDYRIAPLLQDQHRDWMPWHDFAVSMLGYVFATCYVERGSGYLAQKLEAGYNSAFGQYDAVFRRLGDVEHLRSLCITHHYHMMSFTLEEQDDRFVFRLDPCGSGGRLLRGQMWRKLFEYGGELSPAIAEAHDITFGRAAFPVYCTHCAAHNRHEFAHDVLYFVNDGHAQLRPGMACLQFTYKKGVHVQQVDRALLEQVGMGAETGPG